MITPLDNIILGLLSRDSYSGYEIRMVIKNSALGNYSSSPGSIYPSINKLIKLGLVRKSFIEGKRRLQVTSKGKKSHRAWLVRPIVKDDISKRVDILTLRFAFMDELPKKQTVNFLQEFSIRLSEYIKELLNYHNLEKNNMLLHGRLSLEHGITLYKARLKWVKFALNEITNNE